MEELNKKETCKSGSEADLYQSQVWEISEQETHKACEDIRHGKDPEQVLKKLSKQLTNKLMHAPTLGLRDPELNPVTQWLFGLSESIDDK